MAGPFDETQGLPLMICLNHPSWWDPLMATYLSQRFFADRRQYAPIAAKGLEKYRFFERLGFFGIDEQSRAGAARFLQIGNAVLRLKNGVLWVTAQGRFADVRDRPVKLQGGLGHLAHRAEQPFAFVPIALEYAFWDESKPEAFIYVGKTEIVADGARHSAADWTLHFTTSLQSTQDLLAEQVKGRSPAAFQPLLKGSAGVGGVYDLWRATKSLLRGKRFRAEHGRST